MKDKLLITTQRTDNMFTPVKPRASWLYRLIVFPAFYLISLLPMGVLYVVADFIYLLLRFVFKYRERVIDQNLDNAFPTKNKSQKQQIKHRYYRHLSELFVEIIKAISISPKALNNRFEYANIQLLNDQLNNGQSVTVVLSHTCNWEWVALSSRLQVNADVFITYKPLSSGIFDRLMFHMRSRNNGLPVSMNDTIRAVSDFQRNKKPFVLALIGDQSPSNINGAYWGEFLNQETAFLNGTAKISLKYQLPIFYLHQYKTSRGRYRVEFIPIDSESSLTADDIMNWSVKQMEREIIRQPSYWLWSHRRWKHKKSQQ